jgi:hypothetical protein
VQSMASADNVEENWISWISIDELVHGERAAQNTTVVGAVHPVPAF